MHTRSTVATVVIAASMLAGPAWAASSSHQANNDPPQHTPREIYEIDLRCAADAAAMATRLPATSSDKKKQDTSEMVAKERTRAIEAGAQMSVPASEVDRLISGKRDELLRRAEMSANGGKASDGLINRRLFLPTLECLLDQLGDEINKAKAKGVTEQAIAHPS